MTEHKGTSLHCLNHMLTSLNCCGQHPLWSKPMITGNFIKLESQAADLVVALNKGRLPTNCYNPMSYGIIQSQTSKWGEYKCSIWNKNIEYRVNAEHFCHFFKPIPPHFILVPFNPLCYLHTLVLVIHSYSSSSKVRLTISTVSKLLVHCDTAFRGIDVDGPNMN